METGSVDYYEILGISRDADQEQVKKAYRKLALRWHPDKNLDQRELAESNFKRLAEAYEVLSDTQKRQVYDRYGKDGVASGGPGNSAYPDGAGGYGGFGGGFPAGMADLFGASFGPFGGGGGGGMFFSFRDPNDVFREFFGGADPFSDFFNMSQQQNHHQDGYYNSQQQQQYQYPQQQQQQQRSSMDPFSMFSGFGMPFGMSFGGMEGNGGGGMSMSSSTSSAYGPDGRMKKITTSVKMVNGKRIETKRVVDNGVETVTVTENGQVKSKTVNGQAQLTN